MAQAPAPAAPAAPGGQRPASWEDIARAVALQEGVNPQLAIAVMTRESGRDPKAVGDAGKAIGLFQLHPGAAADTQTANRFDPLQNITGGVRYLKQLSTRYNNDLTKTLQAYNGGLDNVDKGTVSPAAQAYAQEILESLTAPAGAAGVPGAPPQAGGLGGRGAPPPAARGGGPGPLSPTAPVFSRPPAAATAGMLPLSTPTTPDEPFYTSPAEKERALSQPFVKALTGFDIAGVYDPRLPEGRTNIASQAVSTGVGIATGGAGGALSGTLTGRAIQILAPILAGGVTAAGTVAAENALGTGGDPRSAVGVGLENAGYEAFGQVFAWPMARFGRQFDAPGLARATIHKLRGEVTAVTAEGRALIADTREKVAEAIAAADAIKNAGVREGPRAAANLAQQQLDGATQLANIAKQYNNLLAQSPSQLAAGARAGTVLTGPAKQALDNVGQQVAAAAKQGPPIPIAPLRDLVNDLAAQWKPVEIFGDQEAATAAGAQLAAIKQQFAGALKTGRISPAEYQQQLQQLANMRDPTAALELLPGVLGKIQQVGGETIPFETAHTLKQILDSAVNWDERAKSVVGRLTKATREGLREQMAGFKPYDDATAAYEALIPLHVRGVGKEMIRLARDPDGAVEIANMLASGDAAQALVLKNLLVDQASAAGELSQGMHAWNAVRAAYTHNHLLAGGIGGLTKRLDDLMTLRPEFVRAVYNDPVGAQIWQNLAQLSDAYKAGRAALEASGKAEIAGAKATAAGAKQRVATDVQKFADSSLDKFTRRTMQSTEADIALAAGTKLGSIFGIQAAIRLLQSPRAADVLEWAAYSNHNTHKLTRLLTSPVPAEFAAGMLREMAGVVAPPGQRGDRITPTGTAAR